MPKISGLPQDTAPVGADYIVVLQTGTTTTKKMLLSDLVSLMNVPRVASIASSATPTPNADTTDELVITALATGMTLEAPTGTPNDGQNLIIRIKDNGSAQTIAYDAIYRVIGVTLPTTTVSGKTIYLGMKFNAADDVWDVLSVGRQA